MSPGISQAISSNYHWYQFPGEIQELYSALKFAKSRNLQYDFIAEILNIKDKYVSRAIFGSDLS
jgi:hypothetical protein